MKKLCLSCNCDVFISRIEHSLSLAVWIVVSLTYEDGSPNWVSENKTIEYRFFEVKSNRTQVSRAECTEAIANAL